MAGPPNGGDLRERRVMATGTVRFWAAARAAAGTHEAAYDAETLGAVVAALRSSNGPELARVLGHCSFLVDGQRVGLDFLLPEGGVVEVLPPFAGGCGDVCGVLARAATDVVIGPAGKDSRAE